MRTFVGFKVSVNDPRGVNGHDGLSETHREPYELLTEQRAMGSHLVGQIPSLDVLSDEIGVF
jgi:hypothetical protein